LFGGLGGDGDDSTSLASGTEDAKQLTIEPIPIFKRVTAMVEETGDVHGLEHLDIGKRIIDRAPDPKRHLSCLYALRHHDHQLRFR
jgi:hypothetical protein